ncbi:MAG: Nif3-like dinuclear metal center hexameric protein [Paludibacteraceae bacterium]|nr:Nif3-like dinuclear metal center hexameric protein [Paludibacteraceae bacterium]
MTTVRDIANKLEAYAPLRYQESYDNSGLLVGDPSATVTGVLLSIDCTEEVLEEAKEKGCNMVVSHHPLIFRGLKQLTGRNYVQRCVAYAIKNDIALYACHTNLDKMPNGVSCRLAQKLGLKNIQPLATEEETVYKLVTFVPNSHTEAVADALFKAGAGTIGEYDECSYRSSGNGTFKANNGCQPYCGTIGERHTEPEDRLEVIVKACDKNKAIKALVNAHPYETPAFDLFESKIGYSPVGLGCIGELEAEEDETDFLIRVKKLLGLGCIRHTALKGEKVRKVALCGGAGHEFLGLAEAMGADMYLTSDIKYHEFFDAGTKTVLADVGHFESEQFTKEIFYDVIYEKNSNFVIHKSEINTNPIKYL